MLTDLNTAFEAKEDYFLGSIMLIEEDGSQTEFSIVDGQQRLATVTILLSAMRNYFKREDADNDRHSEIERDFLFNTDMRSRERNYNLTLSERDGRTFEQILVSPDEIDLNSTENNMITALKECTEYLEKILSSVGKPIDKLLDFYDYLLNKAQVIVVKTSNESSAFMIFETLNDRGLSLSLADMVKNYLFGRAGDKIEMAKTKWTSMIGAFTALGAENELTDFMRYYWLSKYGYVYERQLFSTLKDKINSKNQAVQFIEELEQAASHYLALENPDAKVWTAMGPDAQRLIGNIKQMKFIQYKPLMLAILNSIDSQKAIKSMLAVSENWAVRLTYSSGSRSGAITAKFSEAAVKISANQLVEPEDIKAEIHPIIPDDETFKERFAVASVRVAATSRYLLRKIENRLREDQGITKELEVSENASNVNLEHIVPKIADLADWGLDATEHSQILHRLGNQTLMLSTDNSASGSEPFAKKLKYYQDSEILITKQIADKYPIWGRDQIATRQEFMSHIAVRAWPK